MRMSQNIINQNLNNALSFINKALMNVLIRQNMIFSRQNDIRMTELIAMDMELLKQLQAQLDRMKIALKSDT